MIKGIKPYTTYKPSGVEWLGNAPEHWEIRRLRNVADMRVSNVDKHVKDGENPVRLCNYVDVYNNDYINKRMDFMHATATNEEIERFRLERDDVLITKDSETWVDIGLPALVTEPAWDLILGYHLALLRPRPEKLAGAYLLRALQSKGLAYQFHVEAKGVTRYGLSHAGITSVWLPLPSLSEQAANVRFLDHADGCIQRYIQAKQKLLQLLEEQKQAVIHQAVTGKIDVHTGKPYSAYKPSGVEWLGDVPEHWEVRRVKSLSIVKRGASPRPIGDSRYFDDNGEYAWVRISDVTASNNYLEVTTQRLSRLGQSLSVRLQPGALFLSIAGSVGKPIITKIKCCIHDGFVYFPQFSGNAEFLYRVFFCGAPFARLGKLGTQLNLNTNTVGGVYLGWPPESEQGEIVDFLVDATEGIDSALASIKRQISLLQEYRTRLIADVVTGKLDVREAAAELPEEDEFRDAEKSANEYGTEKDVGV